MLKQNPFERPTVKRPKRSPKPRFHAASKEAFAELEAEFAEFNVLYDLASEALRSGDLSAAHRFPPGCFPPALAFVKGLAEHPALPTPLSSVT